MSWKFAFCAGGAAMLLATSALAHHPTGVAATGGAGPINTISASTLDKGQSSASIMFEIIKLDPLSDAFLANFGATHGHDQHVHSLSSILAPAVSLAYGVTADFTISARVPFIARTDIREGAHLHPGGGAPAIGTVDVLGDASGIGDLTLMGQYRVLNDRALATEVAVLFGVKPPTGATNRRTDTGEVFDAEFQPGTGSWDAMVGLAASKRLGPWSLDANILYVLASQGTQQTDLGDRLQYNAAVSYRLLGGPTLAGMRLGALPEPMYHGGPHSHREAAGDTAPSAGALDLVLELNGEWHAKTVQAGVTDANSGGNVLFLSPGLRYSMNAWSSFVSVGVPIIADLNGAQAEPDWRLFTGVAVNF